MDIINGQIKNIVDPTDAQDAMTMNTANNTASGIPRVWKNGTQLVSAKEYWSTAVVASGVARFYLTSDHTGSGSAIFTTIYKESMNFLIEDASNTYQFSGITIDANKKYVDVTVGRLGTVILGIIQFITAANGVTIYLQVKGD